MCHSRMRGPTKTSFNDARMRGPTITSYYDAQSFVSTTVCAVLRFKYGMCSPSEMFDTFSILLTVFNFIPVLGFTNTTMIGFWGYISEVILTGIIVRNQPANKLNLATRKSLVFLLPTLGIDRARQLPILALVFGLPNDNLIPSRASENIVGRIGIKEPEIYILCHICLCWNPTCNGTTKWGYTATWSLPTRCNYIL